MLEHIIALQEAAERERSKKIKKPSQDEINRVGEQMARLERDIFRVIIKYNVGPGMTIGVLEKLKLRIYDNRKEGIKNEYIRAAMKGLKKQKTVIDYEKK